MNERIRKLAKESGLSISQAYSAEFNKFAELIVRESIKLSQPQVEYPVDGTWIEKAYWEGCYDSSNRIKEHFGVE